MTQDQQAAHDAYYEKYGRKENPETGVDMDQALFEAADLGFTAIPLQSEMREFTLALWSRGYALVDNRITHSVS